MRFYQFLPLVLLFFFMSPLGETANILVTTVGIAGSQNLVMYRLAELMGQRGHNVTVLKAELFPEAKSIPLKHAREISYSLVADPEALGELRSSLAQLPWAQTQNTPVPITEIIKIFRLVRDGCERLLDRKDFIQSLNDSHFDVIVIHTFDFCTFGLTRVLNIDAYVWMSTAYLIDPMAWYSGSPLATSYIPNFAPPADPSGRMSFLDRVQNAFASLFLLSIFRYGVVGGYTESFRKKYGPEFPDFDEILRKTQLYFVNADPMFEYGRPIPENVINVGGLTMKKVEPLTEKWQKLVDNAPKEGVVIFSLGSVANTSTMPQETRLAFLNAFKRFQHLFIWRFEGDFPEAKSVKNVHLANWLPQKDLMEGPKQAHRNRNQRITFRSPRNNRSCEIKNTFPARGSNLFAKCATLYFKKAQPNVKAAIIHGGYNSLTETTYMGVPVVVLPLWSDQFGNAVRVTRQNVGVKLSRHNLSEETVYEALKKVLYDQTIQESAKRLGQMIREKPFSSLQRATEWLEYLAKFKRLDQLQPQSHDIYLFQYFLLDVVVSIVSILVIVFAILAVCVRWCVRKCKRSAAKSKGKQKKNKKE